MYILRPIGDMTDLSLSLSVGSDKRSFLMRLVYKDTCRPRPTSLFIHVTYDVMFCQPDQTNIMNEKYC